MSLTRGTQKEGRFKVYDFFDFCLKIDYTEIIKEEHTAAQAAF